MAGVLNITSGGRLRQLRWRHRLRRLKRAIVAALAIFFAAPVIGFFVGGIGIDGIFITFVAMVAAFVLLSIYPKMPVPRAEDLGTSDLDRLPGNTQIWLETQRPLLPPGARKLVDRIGADLDQLSPQLHALGDQHEAAHEVRKLVGEHLPSLVESYTRLPVGLRQSLYAGSTPDVQLVGGLQVIAREIETMTRQIARGELDQLAVRGRYLETRYPTIVADDHSQPAGPEPRPARE